MRSHFRTFVSAAALGLAINAAASAQETLWIEAEHLRGIKGYCWPMGRPELYQTNGRWGLSGPGWAAEWNQGGESGFLSIATGPGDDQAEVSKEIEVPEAGRYFVWVRYGDWREQPERFDVAIAQDGQQPWAATYGEHPMVEEDNEMKLYWGWGFAWDVREAELAKGEASLTLRSTHADPVPRQVDVIVVTSDASYRPWIKERPHNDAWEILESYRNGIPEDLEPLARRRGDFELPEAWRVETFNDEGFVYLWNAGVSGDVPPWLGDDPNRVPVPYNLRDENVLEEFEATYAGRTDVPIFGDPRIVPAFHGVGAAPFTTDGMDGPVEELGHRLAAWLDADPDRKWSSMMNYHPGKPIGPAGQAMFEKYRNRYVGSISGESLGYFAVDAETMKQATADARTRRDLAEAFSPLTVEANAAKYREIYGKDLDENAFLDVISCMSVGNITFAPLLSQWGSRTIGYESAVATSTVLNMRWAFMRGIARQGDHLTATYRSCNFGDSATMFSNAQSYSGVQNLLDNYYSVYSGAGMSWYKLDIWYQYMAGSSMFYHEQGFDEFWKPGGTTVAGVRPLELSPKGKLVDRFLRTTAEDFDRGDPFTPVAFLVDYAHGWEPAPYWPNAFKNWHQQPDRFPIDQHDRMLQNYFWLAYHPIGPKSEQPITALSEVYLPGVFGDIFDVTFAYPDVERWTTIDTYPVVIAAGEIELTEAEGRRLAQYVEQGGTLLVADAHLTGPGVAALELPLAPQEQEAAGYQWLNDTQVHPSPRYRFRAIDAQDGRVLATTPEGEAIAATFDRGQGRLIVLSVPHGMAISGEALPLLPRLFAHLSRGLMPVEVTGDVQWLLNRNQNGWMVTLLNPAGQDKPQQGITPTDYDENRTVTIRSRVPVNSAVDRLRPSEALNVEQNENGATIELIVPAGGVRLVELK